MLGRVAILFARITREASTAAMFARLVVERLSARAVGIAARISFGNGFEFGLGRFAERLGMGSVGRPGFDCFGMRAHAG